jgi:hypothetical protein
VLLGVFTDLAYRFLFPVRRAGENTTAIAATALSSPASKLVAEVIVTGSVNALPFEIIRRRSARKAELHFTFNGAVLTTQAVKDTQALIDEQLGIQGGLLQRCCFFGQHTHTMQVSIASTLGRVSEVPPVTRSCKLRTLPCSFVDCFQLQCLAHVASALLLSEVV